MRTILIFIGLLAAFFVFKHFYYQPKFVVGAEAPAFEMVMNNGEMISLEDFKGKYVLIDFWGSWCGPCRKENPNIVRLFEMFHGKEFKHANDFEILSVAIETDKVAWERAIKQDRLYWDTHIVELERFESPLASMYGVKSIPTTYLINPKGRIIGVNMTYENMRDLLMTKLSD